MDECVAGEQWEFYTLAPVTPAAHLGDGRQERRDALLLQSRGHSFLMPRPRMNGIPAGWGDHSQLIRYGLANSNAAHSYALSVTERLSADSGAEPALWLTSR